MGNAGNVGNAGNAGTAGNVGNGIDIVQLLLCNIIAMCNSLTTSECKDRLCTIAFVQYDCNVYFHHVQTSAPAQQIRASAFFDSFAKAIRASTHNVQIAKKKLHSPVVKAGLY